MNNYEYAALTRFAKFCKIINFDENSFIDLGIMRKEIAEREGIPVETVTPLQVKEYAVKYYGYDAEKPTG